MVRAARVALVPVDEVVVFENWRFSKAGIAEVS